MVYILIAILIIIFLLIAFILIKTYKKYKNKKDYEKILNKDFQLYEKENDENLDKVTPHTTLGKDNTNLNKSLSNSSKRYIKSKD